ncbi:MAG: hypothetical protein ABJA66_10770, partial [Actinomycetota bacterium]
MNSSLKKEEITADPFAEDIFAVESAGEHYQADTSSATKAENLNLWSSFLPKASSSASDWNNLWRSLPPDFSDKLPVGLADSLARILNWPAERRLDFLFLVQREINRAEDFTPENVWWLTVGIEESKAEISFELDNSFAVRLVDAMLGEKITGSGQIRDLTFSEQSVLEFLSLNLTAEANLILQAPLFKFRALSRDIPDFLLLDQMSEQASRLVLNWQTVDELLPGIIKMYLAPEALQSLQPGENR